MEQMEILSKMFGSQSDRAVSTRSPVVLGPSQDYTGVPATVIFLHGMADQGDKWSELFNEKLRQPHIKYIFPHASTLPVFIAFGTPIPAWFNIFGLTPDSREDSTGIEAATRYVHSLIDEEIRRGTPPERIILGGRSMGGALAVYAGLTYPKRLGGIFSVSGFLVQRHKLPGDHKANLSTPVWLAHGELDIVVPYAYAMMSKEAIEKYNSNVTLHTYPVSHEVSPESMDHINEQFIMVTLPKMG